MSLVQHLKDLPKPIKAAAAIVAAVGILSVVLVTANKIKTDRYYENLSKELAAEEADETEHQAQEPTAADNYVNDFTYAVEVKVSNAGFNPSTILVKPNTKIIFNGDDDYPHFISTSPGSPVPKFFDPKIDVTKHTVFQTRLEEAGTYSFYDTYNPVSTLIVTTEKE